MIESTLTFLGKDYGFGEKNTSAFFEDRTDFYLFDCGYTVFNILKSKINFNKYDNIYIFITHLHNDHAGSLSQLLLFLWYTYNKKATVISHCVHIQDYLAITGAQSDTYKLQTKFNGLEFILTKHIPDMDCYGLKIELAGKKIVYTGDTCELAPFLPYLKNADEFYTDTSINGNVHLKISEVLPELLQIQKNGTNVFLMHLDDEKTILELTDNQFSPVKELL